MQPPSYVELVETSHWRVSLLYYAYSSPSQASNRHYVGAKKSLGGRKWYVCTLVYTCVVQVGIRYIRVGCSFRVDTFRFFLHLLKLILKRFP